MHQMNEYRFCKISDFLQLSEDEFAQLVSELPNWHRESKKIVAEEKVPLKFFDTFKWTVDGKTDVVYITPIDNVRSVRRLLCSSSNK